MNQTFDLSQQQNVSGILQNSAITNPLHYINIYSRILIFPSIFSIPALVGISCMKNHFSPPIINLKINLRKVQHIPYPKTIILAVIVWSETIWNFALAEWRNSNCYGTAITAVLAVVTLTS